MRQFLYILLKTSYSMKTGLVLLALLGIFSALGTSILPDIFYRLLLFNLLMIMLFINLVLCTINRLIQLRRQVFIKQHNLMNQIRQWGLLALHIGLILILVGGIINTCVGQSGTVQIAEGERAVIAENEAGEKISLFLEDFEIERYENDMPSQYYSKVQLYKSESLELQSIISVNNPLQYQGIKVYQQSYGNMVDVTIQGEEKAENHTAVEGEVLDIPGGNWRVKVFKYVPDFDPAYGMESRSMQANNPRVIYSVYKGDVLLGVGAAPFGEEIKIDDTSWVQFNGLGTYSIFKVKEDPGLPYAGAGGIIFMIGAALAEISIFRRKAENGSQISGRRNDNGSTD